MKALSKYLIEGSNNKNSLYQPFSDNELFEIEKLMNKYENDLSIGSTIDNIVIFFKKEDKNLSNIIIITPEYDMFKGELKTYKDGSQYYVHTPVSKAKGIDTLIEDLQQLLDNEGFVKDKNKEESSSKNK